jgi:hypothetical protein
MHRLCGSYARNGVARASKWMPRAACVSTFNNQLVQACQALQGAVAPGCTALLACHHCSAAWAVLAGGAGADEVIGALLVAAGVGGASAEAALVAGLVAALLVLGGATGEARGAACRYERQQAARAQGREQVRMSRGGKGKGEDRHRLRRSSTAHPLAEHQ